MTTPKTSPEAPGTPATVAAAPVTATGEVAPVVATGGATVGAVHVEMTASLGFMADAVVTHMGWTRDGLRAALAVGIASLSTVEQEWIAEDPQRRERLEQWLLSEHSNLAGRGGLFDLGLFGLLRAKAVLEQEPPAGTALPQAVKQRVLRVHWCEQVDALAASPTEHGRLVLGAVRRMWEAELARQEAGGTPPAHPYVGGILGGGVPIYNPFTLNAAEIRAGRFPRFIEAWDANAGPGWGAGVAEVEGLVLWPRVRDLWRQENAAELAARQVLAKDDADVPGDAGRAAGRLAEEVRERLRDVKQDDPASPWWRVVPPAEGEQLPGELYQADDAAARYFDALGAEGTKLREAAVALAGEIRAKARERLDTWRKQGVLTGTRPEAPWERWQDRLLFPRQLAGVLWRGEVRAQLEREREKESSVVRASTGLVQTFGQARVHGGRIVGAEIHVVPPSGIALALPFDQTLRVSDKGSGVVGLRQVLSARALRTYLATLVLYQDAGQREEGSFEIEGPGTILDLTGAAKHEDRQASRTYHRYHSKDTRAVAEDLALFSQVRVRSVGTMEAAGGDPLVDEITDKRNGKHRFYAHSRLIVAELHNSYIRIPRAVCKLQADDVPLGLGIAAIARQLMLRHMKSGKAIEAPISEWLEACGIDAKERSRKEGLAFWPRIAEELARVAEEGKLGTLSCSGKGKELVLSLGVEQSLRDSYKPLLDAAHAQQKAKHAARVRQHKK